MFRLVLIRFGLRLDALAVAVYETVRLLRLCSLFVVPFLVSVPSFWFHFLLVSHHQRFGLFQFVRRSFSGSSVSVCSSLRFLIPLSSSCFVVHPVAFVLILVAGNLRLRSRCMRPYGCCVFVTSVRTLVRSSERKIIIVGN